MQKETEIKSPPIDHKQVRNRHGSFPGIKQNIHKPAANVIISSSTPRTTPRAKEYIIYPPRGSLLSYFLLYARNFQNKKNFSRSKTKMITKPASWYVVQNIKTVEAKAKSTVGSNGSGKKKAVQNPVDDAGMVTVQGK